MYGLPDPASWHTFFDDFDTYVAADWVVTEVGIATQVLTDEDGGVLLITNAAADNDSSFSQLLPESFKFEAGKRVIFKARFKISDAVQSDFVMGLQIKDTTPLAVSDGVFFMKDDGDALLDFSVFNTSVGVTRTALASLVTATHIEVAFHYNGKDEVQAFANGALAASILTSAIAVPTTELTVSYGVQNGEAVAKTMSVDYILVAKER
jgi:hypothetical protein